MKSCLGALVALVCIFIGYALIIAAYVVVISAVIVGVAATLQAFGVDVPFYSGVSWPW